MQTAVVGVIALILVTSYMAYSQPVTQAEVVQVRAASAPEHHREPFNYIPIVEVIPVPDVAVVKSTKKFVAPIVVEVAPTAQPQPVIPKQDPAIAACVGKAAGSACSYGGSVGTCLTPAFSAETCVAH